MSFFVIFFSLIFYGVPIASLIIWYKTKDATNKYLKILYKIRFSFGLIALLASIILDFILELKKQIRDEFIVSPLFHNVSDNLKNNDFFNISYETIFKEVSRDSYLWRQNKHKTYTKQPLKFLLFEKNDLVLLALNSELDFKEGKVKHKFTCTEIQKKDLVIKE